MSSNIFGADVRVSAGMDADREGVTPDDYDYYNVESVDKCWASNTADVYNNISIRECATNCNKKETAVVGACAGFAFKITSTLPTNISDANADNIKGECVLKFNLANCEKPAPALRNFDPAFSQVFYNIKHDAEKAVPDPNPVKPIPFSFSNFAPATLIASPSSLPTDKTMSYSGTTLGTLSSTTGGIFCKTVTLGINTIAGKSYPKLDGTNVSTVRCFAYVPSTTTIGKCYIKDFTKTDVATAVTTPIPNGTSWTTDPAANPTAFQCYLEGGSLVQAELALKQAPFTNTSFVPKPITSGTVAAANTVVNTLKYGAANISTGTGVTFFCKTTTAAGTPATDFLALNGGTDTTKPVRCFAYMASTVAAPADVGKCYIKDFKDLASVQAAAVVVPNGWVEQPKVATAAESYCVTEAGGTVVSTAILPLYLTSNFDPLVTAPTAESKTVKYKTTVLTTVTDGSVFCKSAVTAPSPTGVALAANAVRCFNFTYGKEGIGGDCYFKDFDATNYTTAVALTGWTKLASTTDTQPSYCDSEGGSFVVAKTKALPMPVVATTTIAPPPPVVTATPEPTPTVTATPVLQQAVVSPYYYELVFPPKFDQTTGQVIQGAGGAKYERDPNFPDGSFCNRSSPYLRASLKPEDPYYNMTKAKKRTISFLKKTGPSDEANTHPQDLPISECYEACNKDDKCIYVLYSEKSMKCYMFAHKADVDGAPLTNAGCSPFALTPDPSGTIDINGIKYNKKDYFGKLVSPDDAANNPDGYKYYIKRTR